MNTMRTIIAADIFGVTAALRSMLRPVAGDALFLSPWDTDACPFPDEQAAASAFVSCNGIEAYAEKIAAAANREPAFIIAFSVGASAAWIHSASSSCHPESAAILFYGSRIREYSSLAPIITVKAIFAETEASFSPGQLAKVIASDTVRTCIEPGTCHGFMNPLSVNFAPAQCSVHLQRLGAELAQFHQHLTGAAGKTAAG